MVDLGMKMDEKRKKMEVKMDGLLTVLREGENMCRKFAKEEEEAKTNAHTRDQAASHLLSGWGDISKWLAAWTNRLVAWLLSSCTLVNFRPILINFVTIL